ncbi:MAG: response regulator transcription factor [Sphingobacteriales bacterium]|nr:MAG: response regulator transcription factor [Sphingobacteriales bacterium]
MNPITVLITDDHRIFREGLKTLLKKSRAEDIDVIAEADNGLSSIERAVSLDPDIVLMDIQMPSMDGITATREFQRRRLRAGIIGLSTFNDILLIQQMISAGAKGYLLKNADKHEVAEAIRTVYQEEPYYCKHTSARLAQMIAKSKFNPYKKSKKAEFTDRELEIIRLICQELTNKEIADQLFLSIRTVEGYRLKIQEKMDVKNSIGLVIYAIRNNLYKPA